MSYTYDDNGLRVSKTVFGETTYLGFDYAGRDNVEEYAYNWYIKELLKNG